MDFKGKIAAITGGAQGIGRCIAEEFQKAGATACVIDKQQGNHFVGDLADKQVLERFAKEVIEQHGHVDFLVNNALPLMKGIDECSSQSGVWAIPWILRTWCSISVPTRRASSQARTSVSTAA